LKRLFLRFWACAWLAVLVSTGCRVDETHVRCSSQDDCASAEECYLSYCVLKALDAGASASSDAVTRSDAGRTLRRRPTPTLTGRGQADAGDRVSVGGDVETCVSSEEDAGAGEGACCEKSVACYEGPSGTLEKGLCKAGTRACEDGRLGSCEDSVKPRTETCENQGTDDDCDGELDNVRDRGKACMVESDEPACRQGALACVKDEDDLQCVPNAPPPEQCNTKDDDCDSKVDEGFDLTKDALNCGACNTRCTDMQACCMGACVARGPGPDGCPLCSPTMPCEAGRSCCSGGCVDMQADRNHCGACGNACGARQTCCGGTCVDTRTDERNCGGCGTTCTMGTSPSCCSGDCVDVSDDRRHCGQCGNNCGAVCSCEVENGQPICRGPLGICF
jgi:hypothetical protein